MKDWEWMEGFSKKVEEYKKLLVDSEVAGSKFIPAEKLQEIVDFCVESNSYDEEVTHDLSDSVLEYMAGSTAFGVELVKKIRTMVRWCA
jgi:hypothetical protein